MRRAKTIKIQAYDLKGQPVEKIVSDLEARAWQHEIDHLNGVLFIDKMGPLAKFASREPSRTSSKISATPRNAARFRRNGHREAAAWRLEGKA